jgi:hypothetical protein
MKLREFLETCLGKKVDFDGRYGGQCVDLFRLYCRDVLELPAQPRGVAGAADFWTNYETDPILQTAFDKIANTPSGVPRFGDVVIWNKRAGRGYGHIAIFLHGDGLRFTSLDQNWPALSVVAETTHDYVHVLGWLRPKAQDKILADPLAEPD